jgi:hypothetical protein
MDADRLPTEAKHIRDAKLWAVAIIVFALLVAAADLVGQFLGTTCSLVDGDAGPTAIVLL